MIFVTVGTHEQQFDRLVEYMDQWAGEHEENVIIQTGYSRYKPENCQWKKLYSYEEMDKLTDEARIVISHGGPSSFIMSLQAGKIPIIVPRQVVFREHINDHQVDFCREVEKRWENVIVVEEIGKLGDVIERYDEITKNMKNNYVSNNDRFCLEFERIVEDL
ncbi:MAG: multidrug MFS transporter [Lachnospiraceae bacterium]|nr:multidrug MFS transporter [Lachnospiraceae bacterium]